MIWFTADEHYGHENVIKYCNRPFENAQEMNEELIARFNSVVGKDDVIIHAGDFTLQGKEKAQSYIKRLRGNHIFLRGSHDYWLPKSAPQIYEKTIEGQYVVVCHYAMRTWARSHWNSWQLYGHSHGGLPPEGKQWDVGVDNNGLYPVSFEQIKDIMKERPDNFNFIKS